MDITGNKTENPLYNDDIDQQFDLLLQKVEELDRDDSLMASSETVAPIVDWISQERHITRIRLSRAIEEFITSWKPGNSVPRLRCTILAGLGLQNSTTERGVKSIVRQIGDYLRSLPKDTTRIDLLSIVDAIARFYREYPNDFEFKYLEELFRFSEPTSFQITSSLAAIMLGMNHNAPGRLKLADVVDTLFSADDIDTFSEAEKGRVVSDIIHALPTHFWSQHLYRLDDPHAIVPHAHKGRLAFLRFFLLSDPPILALFSVEDITYIVRPSDLLREYEEGQSVRAAIKACAARLREPMQTGGFSVLDSEYQDLLGFALERSHAWQCKNLTADVIPIADYQSKNSEGSW